MLHILTSSTARINQSAGHGPENWWLQGSAKKLPLEGHSHYLGRKLNVAPALGRLISSIADRVGGTANDVMSVVCRTEQLWLYDLLDEKGIEHNGTFLTVKHLRSVFAALTNSCDSSFREPTSIRVTGIDVYESDQSVNMQAGMQTPKIERAVGSPYHTRTYLAARVIVGATRSQDSSLMVPFGWIQVPNSRHDEVTAAIRNLRQDGLATPGANRNTPAGLVVDASPLCIIATPTERTLHHKVVFQPM